MTSSSALSVNKTIKEIAMCIPSLCTLTQFHVSFGLCLFWSYRPEQLQIQVLRSILLRPTGTFILPTDVTLSLSLLEMYVSSRCSFPSPDTESAFISTKATRLVCPEHRGHHTGQTNNQVDCRDVGMLGCSVVHPRSVHRTLVTFTRHIQQCLN